MIQYLNLMNKILSEGNDREDRTGVGTLSLFGEQMEYDLSENTLPAITTRKMYFKGIIYELLWFLSGDTNIKYLVDNDVHIWDDNAYDYYKSLWQGFDLEPNLSKKEFIKEIEEGDMSSQLNELGYIDYRLGDCGPIYGLQWRNYNNDDKVDQIARLVKGLRENPYSRRHILMAWNPLQLKQMALPPCHVLCQFYVHDGELHSHLYQRSADFCLGVPFNITSYSLLTHLIAKVTGLEASSLTHSFGDVHIYKNHIDTAKKQLKRFPYDNPKLELVDKERLHFGCGDVKIKGYKHHPKLDYEMNV